MGCHFIVFRSLFISSSLGFFAFCSSFSFVSFFSSTFGVLRTERSTSILHTKSLAIKKIHINRNGTKRNSFVDTVYSCGLNLKIEFCFFTSVNKRFVSTPRLNQKSCCANTDSFLTRIGNRHFHCEFFLNQFSPLIL